MLFHSFNSLRATFGIVEAGELIATRVVSRF
jgi:hypothetical protein